VGSLGALFVTQGVYEFLAHTSVVDIASALCFWTIGATTVRYQAGFAPWGHPDDET
jgi:hypothetical protein